VVAIAASFSFFGKDEGLKMAEPTWIGSEVAAHRESRAKDQQA
jgi:hypothetical protein